MGTGVHAGVNWSYENGLYTIFGKRGSLTGKDWIVSVDALGGVLAHVDAAPISGDILKIIEDDTLAGNADKIAYIGVAPQQAVFLALEGVISVQQLARAVETTDRIMLDVALAGRAYKLVVLRDAVYTMATYDRSDQVVE